MRVELLYFDGCPNYERLLGRLRRVLADEGVEADVELLRMDSPEAAERERFVGSPTVRVDGDDVEPGAGRRREYGLACRVYRWSGGIARYPPEPWIRSALRAGRDRERANALR